LPVQGATVVVGTN